MAKPQAEHCVVIAGGGFAGFARPAIDIRQSFSDAATAAGLINAGETFDVP